MIAMRYGTLPVVRETGGLRDSVVPYNQYTGEGTGFSFANMNADEMANSVLYACEVFWTQKDVWQQLHKGALHLTEASVQVLRLPRLLRFATSTMMRSIGTTMPSSDFMRRLYTTCSR